MPFLLTDNNDIKIQLTEEERIDKVKSTLSVSEADIEEYRELFEKLDKDGNGMYVRSIIFDHFYHSNG